MSLYLKIKMDGELSKEKEDEIVKMGWELNLNPYGPKEEKTAVNLVSVDRPHCRYPEIQIGRPETRDSVGFLVPKNPENIEIIRKIFYIALGEPLFPDKVK